MTNSIYETSDPCLFQAMALVIDLRNQPHLTNITYRITKTIWNCQLFRLIIILFCRNKVVWDYKGSYNTVVRSRSASLSIENFFSGEVTLERSFFAKHNCDY